MKKNFGKQTYLYPMPVLIIATYNEDGSANAMNAAWGGIHDTNQIGICLDSTHKTTQNILNKKAFSVSVADVDHVVEADYLGVVSANQEQHKLEKAHLTVSKCEFVDAPMINEFKMTLECQMVSYDENSGYLVANIVNVCADEKILKDGKIDVTLLKPITYDPVSHSYFQLGGKVGNAFKDGLELK